MAESLLSTVVKKLSWFEYFYFQKMIDALSYGWYHVAKRPHVYNVYTCIYVLYLPGCETVLHKMLGSDKKRFKTLKSHRCILTPTIDVMLYSRQAKGVYSKELLI